MLLIGRRAAGYSVAEAAWGARGVALTVACTVAVCSVARAQRRGWVGVPSVARVAPSAATVRLRDALPLTAVAMPALAEEVDQHGAQDESRRLEKGHNLFGTVTN